MKKIITIIAITLFGSGTVAGAIFYRQSMDKDSALEAHRTQIATLNDRLSQLDADRKTLQKQFADTIDQLNALKNNNQYVIQLESILQEKERAISGARQEINQCVGSKEALLDQLAAEKKSTASLNDLLVNSQERIQTLTGRIEKNRSDDAALIADLTARMKTGRETVRDLEKQLNQAKTRILSEQERVRTLRTQLQTTEEKASAFEKRIEAKTIQYAHLEKQVAGIQSEKGSVESKLKELKTTYDGLVKELNENIKNKEATIEECKEKLAISFIDRVLFRSAMITIAPEGREALKKVGNILKNLNHGKIRIVGHTDNRPIRARFRNRFPTNWELSSARAAAVARFFEKENGIAPDRMEVVGYSYHQPLADNDLQEGRSKNRRVEIIVVPSPVSG